MTVSIDQRIREQVAFAYQNAPAVRKIMEGAGVKPEDIQSTADLAKIPVLSKDRLVELQQENPPFGGMLAIPPENLSHIFISPGPIFDPVRSPKSLAGALDAARAAGFSKGDIVLNTFAYHLTPAGLLMDQGVTALGATVIPTGPGNTELQVMIANQLGATGYVGTPSFLAIIFETAAKLGFSPKEMKLKKAFFSAEPYPPSMRARFDDEFGMTTVSAYGTADAGFIGYEATGMRGFCISDNLYVEIVDPTTGQPVPVGEIGEIIVTLFDDYYPLVRFGTGDLGSLDPNPQQYCGKDQHLTGLYGRSGGAIKVRGMFLHPNQIESAASKIPDIKYIQAIITRPGSRDHVRVNIQLKPDHSGANIAQSLKEHLETVARLKIDEVVIVDPGVIDPAQRAVRDERKWD